MQLRQQVIGPAHLRDYDATATHKGYGGRLFLLAARHTQPGTRADNRSVKTRELA
jgi:hypothetical protein